MAIDTKSESYKSHKYKYNVYVDINSKTKMGQNLLKQYHEQSSRHYMDIGRIGYHDDYGRYKLDEYTIKELKVVPKLILRVTERAMSRAGRDVYQLRTYMSKFGQLNFLLTVDQTCAELYLVENVYISNLNHREDYETLIWKTYYQKPVPLKQIFCECGIKANPDDYGKSWKEEDIKINNILVCKAKADMTCKIANTVASALGQKALVTSLNYLNSAKEYGKKITKSYSEKVAKSAEINKLASSPKLENTLNHVLVKTLEQKTDKRDVKNKKNLQTYNNVVKVQFAVATEVVKEVEKQSTKENLKNFMLQTYEKNNVKKEVKEEQKLFDEKQEEFKKTIDVKFNRKKVDEKTDVLEEKFNRNKYEGRTLPSEYRDFENKKVEVDISTERFDKKETRQERKTREKEEKLEKKAKSIEVKQEKKLKKQLKEIDFNCNLDEEFEKSKLQIGIVTESKKEKPVFAPKTKEEKLAIKEEKKNNKKENLLARIENRIKRQNLKLAERKEKREEKKRQVLERREEKKRKQQMMNDQLFEKEEKKKRNFENQFIDERPKVKQEVKEFAPQEKEKAVENNKSIQGEQQNNNIQQQEGKQKAPKEEVAIKAPKQQDVNSFTKKSEIFESSFDANSRITGPATHEPRKEKERSMEM